MQLSPLALIAVLLHFQFPLRGRAILWSVTKTGVPQFSILNEIHYRKKMTNYLRNVTSNFADSVSNWV